MHSDAMADVSQTNQHPSRVHWRLNGKMPWLALLGIPAAVFALFEPASAWAAIRFALENLVVVSPMIVLGIVLTAGITASGSMALIAASFTGFEIRMVVVASFIGALTPVCGITVLPLVAGLLAARVPLAPIMAFWLSSPITDPGMLAITAGALGTNFAIGKCVAAFGAGVLAGTITLALTRVGYLLNPARSTVTLTSAGAACDSGDSQGIRWQFWKEPERRATFLATARSTGKLMLTWLTLAFVAEYFLRSILPPDLLGRFVGADNILAIPIAAMVGAPIYLDGYAALPLVRGLIDSGMGQGAAMAFLVAGGIISAWAVIPVFALVRLPVFALYIVLAVVSAMLSGWGFGVFV